MKKDKIEILRGIVESLHHCRASYLDQIAVIEKFGIETAWQGIVYIFQLTGHPKSKICYAWDSYDSESNKIKYYAVLHIPPVDSPERAVRASIVQDNKNTNRTGIS